MMINRIKKLLLNLNEWNKLRVARDIYESREKELMKRNGIDPECIAENEAEHFQKWKDVFRYPTTYSYRFYAAYCGPNVNIVSEPASRECEKILNPRRYRGFLQDKNNFDKVLGESVFPKTIFRKIGGGYVVDTQGRILDQSRLKAVLDSYDSLIVKDATNSDSGRGVSLFTRSQDRFINSQGESIEDVIYNGSYTDFIGQERVIQHPVLAQFNPTSVNTIRIATYFSPEDNKAHILSSVIRMGATGKFIDNLHGGGKMVRVYSDGCLAKECFNQYGEKFPVHNDVDFSSNNIIISDFHRVENLVTEMHARIPCVKLIQWDASIDQNGTPELIEYNIGGFAMWIAQMTGTPAFGEYTDEIINLVAEAKKKLF